MESQRRARGPPRSGPAGQIDVSSKACRAEQAREEEDFKRRHSREPACQPWRDVRERRSMKASGPRGSVRGGTVHVEAVKEDALGFSACHAVFPPSHIYGGAAPTLCISPERSDRVRSIAALKSLDLMQGRTRGLSHLQSRQLRRV